MKINKVDKIEEHFREIKTESIFTALKEKKYRGIKRYEIDHLLKSYNITQVYLYLKTRYRKNNYLVIYLIGFISLLTILSGIILYFYIINDEFILFKYLDINYYNNLQIGDYSILLLFLLSMLTLTLCIYEIILKIKNFRYEYKK